MLSFASLSLYPIPVFLTTESLFSPASQLLSFLHLSSSSLLLFPHLLPPSLGCYISLPVTLTDFMKGGGVPTVCSTLLPTLSSQFPISSLLPSLYWLSSLFSFLWFPFQLLHCIFSEFIFTVLLLWFPPSGCPNWSVFCLDHQGFFLWLCHLVGLSIDIWAKGEKLKLKRKLKYLYMFSGGTEYVQVHCFADVDGLGKMKNNYSEKVLMNVTICYHISSHHPSMWCDPRWKWRKTTKWSTERDLEGIRRCQSFHSGVSVCGGVEEGWPT